MTKRTLTLTLLSLLLVGCSKNTTSLSDIEDSLTEQESAEEIVDNSYITFNSTNEVGYIYGIINETFNLETINTSNVLKGTLSYQTEGDGISINGSILSMNKKGINKLIISDNTNSVEIMVSVNESEQTRYDYPNVLDLDSHIKPADTYGTVTVLDDTITLKAAGTRWNRVVLPLEKYYSKNYTIECDASFISASDDTRWLGLIFKSDDSTKGYPYYQLDIRKTTNLSGSIEVTSLPGPDSSVFSYLYQSPWNDGGPGVLTENDKVHLKVSIKNQIASCSVSLGNRVTSFDVTVPETAGVFGFSCGGASALFENIKLSFDEDIKLTSFADGSKTIININDEASFGGLKPQIISSGVDVEEIDSVHLDCQQYYVKVDGDSLYSICDEKMDYSFNQLIDETIGDYIPNIQVEDIQTFNKILGKIKSDALSDIAFWSSKVEVLDEIRSKYPIARLGYVATNISKLETYSDVASIAREAGRHYANMILIDSDLLTKDNVHKFDSLGYTVVANAKDGNNYSLIKSAISGVKLIATSYSRQSNSQAAQLYGNTMFNVDEKSSMLNAQTHSLMSIPYVTGHRGAGTNGTNPAVTLPENTIESFKWAFENGAEAIELDIHETKDHQFAVIHDANTQAYSQTVLTVASSTLAELQAIPLKVGNYYSTNYHIPSLEEVFQEFSGEEYSNNSIVIEVKDLKVSTGIKAIELAKQYGWYDRITIITFDVTAARKIREYDPGVQSSYLGTVSRLSNEEYWSSYNSYLSSGVGLASQYSTVDKECLQESNARGQMYWLWTFEYSNSNQILNKIIAGNRAFTTNYTTDFAPNYHSLKCRYDTTLAMNSSAIINVNAINFKNEPTRISSGCEFVILSDNATVNNNTITRTGDGTIYGFAKYKTTWTLFGGTTNFYIYSELFEIN